MRSTILFLFTILLFTECGQQQGSALKQPNSDHVPAIAEYIKGRNLDSYAVATFAGGCFWCTEAAFERIKGVVDVISGYSGGDLPNPSYRRVASGSTKHAEAVQIYFDPEIVSFETLLEVFYVSHDGTQVNRQGPDIGPQYRSEIFYHSQEQRQAAEQYIRTLNDSGKFGRTIATLLNPYKEFWVAESYHQDYYPQHQDNPYIARVSKPKVEKVEKTFEAILKEEYK